MEREREREGNGKAEGTTISDDWVCLECRTCTLRMQKTVLQTAGQMGGMHT